jgi:phosphatidylglycerol:prolipoprotein diacylglycerol transferase
MALLHSQFDPVAFSIFGWPVHWYGLTYLAAFLMFLLIGKYRARKMPLLGFKPIELDDILFYGVLGVILGGRLGYVLFYKPADFLAHPLDIFKVWQGGMSFHGGFLGVLVAMWWYGRKTGRGFWQVVDFIAPLVPLGLAAGRWGNFMNGELWGRVSDQAYSWLMVFPQAQSADEQLLATTPTLLNHPAIAVVYNAMGGLPRHPSQIYQLLGEGLLLFIVLWVYARKIRSVGSVSAVFLIGYGLMRFLAEFAREPDDFLGLFAGFSMGQILSLPMIVFGIGLLMWSYRKNNSAA